MRFSHLRLLVGGLCILTLLGCTSETPVETEVVEEQSEQPPHEVAIGDYEFRSFDPASNTLTRFHFSLAGLVADEELDSLSEELENKRYRVRDRIMIVSRESTTEELEDPQLVMFRRRLLKEINRMIEAGQLRDIYVSHFRVKTR